MKKLVFILLLANLACFGQKAKKDSNGNYIQVQKLKTETPTGKFYIDAKGNKFPLFLSESGKLYYYRTSVNSGKTYKVTLKIVK